jgi:hypothetical protein
MPSSVWAPAFHGVIAAIPICGSPTVPDFT